jgi:hypothetical protein
MLLVNYKKLLNVLAIIFCTKMNTAKNVNEHFYIPFYIPSTVR